MNKFIAAVLAILCFSMPSFADDYIVVVFDSSGSMDEIVRGTRQTRMTVAQNALISALSQAPPTTKVGIITFKGWIYDLQTVDRARLEASIRSVLPNGGTPLYAYIKKGADRLLEEREKQSNIGSYKLIVVTDGEAGDNRLNEDTQFTNGSLRLGYLKDVVSRGIVVDAIGLEIKGQHSLKNQINGVYMEGNDPNSILQSIKKSVAEVGFDAKDSTTQESFDVIAGFPETFVKDSIIGLTNFRNHPIGESPPVIDKNGKVIASAQKPEEEKNLFSWHCFLMFVAFLFLFVVLVVGIFANRPKNRRSY